MSRRRSEESESIFGPNGGEENSADSDDRSPVRQTSLRVSRRSAPGGNSSRVSVSRSAAGGSGSVTASRNVTRARRPTPVAPRRRRLIAEEDGEDFDNEDDNVVNSSVRRQRGASRAGASATTASASFERNQGGSVATYRRYSSNNPSGMTWYDRLMPDFILNLTAPLTGYESQLDSDVEEEEYEILDRERVKRNRRIRRRLLTIVFLATAGAVFMYTRGRLMRKAGVKAAVSTMKHRIEDGLVKSIQETMGK